MDTLDVGFEMRKDDADAGDVHRNELSSKVMVDRSIRFVCELWCCLVVWPQAGRQPGESLGHLHQVSMSLSFSLPFHQPAMNCILIDVIIIVIVVVCCCLSPRICCGLSCVRGRH